MMIITSYLLCCFLHHFQKSFLVYLSWCHVCQISKFLTSIKSQFAVRPALKLYNFELKTFFAASSFYALTDELVIIRRIEITGLKFRIVSFRVKSTWSVSVSVRTVQGQTDLFVPASKFNKKSTNPKCRLWNIFTCFPNGCAL